MLSRGEELEAMKRIDFCQYVASRGFVLDRKKSSRASIVMRHSNGDKLIVGRTPNGQYIYFNAKGNDSGSIIDFVQTRDRVSLGEVRKILRPWLNGSTIPINELPPLPIKLQPSEHDAAQVLANWMKAKPLWKTHPYLEYERQIPREILTSPLLRDRIRIDDRKNAVFPHFNQSGLCGFELKNRGFTGFSPGGIKGLACTRPQPDDQQMIICETAIDMLSYAAVKGLDGKRLFSTAGQISPSQAECLKTAVSKMPEDVMIVLALDNDKGGYELAEKIAEVLADCHRPIMTDFPSLHGGDWNDVLRNPTSSQFCASVSP
ncbi:toprim domain-containing protein [Thalassoglobus sp.]|uniref:toprim domain-containing protein n=1 Tax=Thalassoglobus sp. TaxID=2795869 RepID=UPI003AA9D809